MEWIEVQSGKLFGIVGESVRFRAHILDVSGKRFGLFWAGLYRRAEYRAALFGRAYGPGRAAGYVRRRLFVSGDLAHVLVSGFLFVGLLSFDAGYPSGRCRR